MAVWKDFEVADLEGVTRAVEVDGAGGGGREVEGESGSNWLATDWWRAEDDEAAEAAEVEGPGAEVTGGGAGEAVRGGGKEAVSPAPREAAALAGKDLGADFLGGTGECLTGMAQLRDQCQAPVS